MAAVRTASEDPGREPGAWRVVAVVLAFVVVAGAIAAGVVVGARPGDDQPAESTEAEGGGPPPVTDSPEITALDFSFDPAEIVVPTDVEITLQLTNDGNNAHSWAALGQEIEDESGFDESLVVAQVPEVQAGDAAETTFTLPAGDYQVICTVEGHFDAGMEGRVTTE